MPSFKPWSLIVPAGGKGLRFGQERPKQFLEYQGFPLLFYTLLAFDGAPGLKEIILVLPAEWRVAFEAEHGTTLRYLGVTKIVNGGTRRQDSVLRGLFASDSLSEYLAVHDAVRPLVELAEIEATLAAAIKTGAAILAQKSAATVKRVDETGRIQETLPREKIYLAQTPQAARRDLIIKALEAVPPGAECTDEAAAIERLGEPVQVVEGSSRNLKITTPADLELAAPRLDILAKKLRERLAP